MFEFSFQHIFTYVFIAIITTEKNSTWKFVNSKWKGFLADYYLNPVYKYFIMICRMNSCAFSCGQPSNRDLHKCVKYDPGIL